MKQIITTLALALTLTACAEGAMTSSEETMRRDIPFQTITSARFASTGTPINLRGETSATQMMVDSWHTASKASTNLGSVPVDLFWRRIDSHDLLAIADTQKSEARFTLFNDDRTANPARMQEIRAAIPALTGCRVKDLFQRDVPKTYSGIFIAVLDC